MTPRPLVIAFGLILAASACDEAAPPTQPVEGTAKEADPVSEPNPRTRTPLDDLLAELDGEPVANPGPVHGAWELRVDDRAVAKLHLRQAQGDASVRGVFELPEEGIVGRVTPGANITDDVLNVAWDVDHRGLRHRFAITDGTRMADGRYRVRYAQQRTGSIVDAVLTKQN